MNKNKILKGVGIVAAALLIYNPRIFNKVFEKMAEKIKGEKGKPKEPTQIQPSVVANPLNDPFSFQSKVAKIQNYLGAAIDGIPGPQTNLLLNQKYGKPYGNLSLDNVDKYLKDLHL